MTYNSSFNIISECINVTQHFIILSAISESVAGTQFVKILILCRVFQVQITLEPKTKAKKRVNILTDHDPFLQMVMYFAKNEHRLRFILYSEPQLDTLQVASIPRSPFCPLAYTLTYAIALPKPCFCHKSFLYARF